jgi:hypothetical protein
MMPPGALRHGEIRKDVFLCDSARGEITPGSHDTGQDCGWNHLPHHSDSVRGLSAALVNRNNHYINALGEFPAPVTLMPESSLCLSGLLILHQAMLPNRSCGGALILCGNRASGGILSVVTPPTAVSPMDSSPYLRGAVSLAAGV